MGEKLPRENLWKALLLALLVPILVYSYSTGPPPADTGGFGEPTCNQAGCHTGTAVNAGGGKVTITVSSPSYTSGGAFTVTVTDFDSAQKRWGFELSARIRSGSQAGKQAGTLKIGGDGFTQMQSYAGIQYIAQTLSGARSGVPDTGNGVSFSFTWQAPDISAGPVEFDAAGLAANGDGRETGDHTYTASLVLPPEGPPSINPGGVLNNASYAKPPVLAPGTIVQVFGAFLADGSTAFTPSSTLPTTLAGATLLVNGVPAPLFTAAPGGINAQLPVELAGAATATIEVEVQTANGTLTSPPITVSLAPFSPGIFTWDQNGTGPGAILHNSDFSKVCPPGRSDCAPSPAARGEVVDIFVTGLGQVNGPWLDGQPNPQASPTATTPTVTIGGVQAQVGFSGLAQGYPGLYQVNIFVPQTAPSGNAVPVVVTIGGAVSNTVTMAVQ